MTVKIAPIIHSMLNAYHAKHDLRQVPIKIDWLRPLIEERGWVDRIIWEKYHCDEINIAAQVSFFKAQMGAYAAVGDYARIQYSRSLNLCWQRFVICKEMYHCMIDKEQAHRVTGVEQLMKLAEYLVSETTPTMERYEAYDTEFYAEILALETLFPLELRQYHRAAYEAGEISDYQLALRYRIPEDYARSAMYPDYFRQISKVRQDTLIF
jgi:hypothetical protein